MYTYPDHSTNAFLLEEDFENNRHSWEETDSATAMSRVSDGCYEMINHTEDEWHFYAMRTGLCIGHDFLLEATVLVDPSSKTGHAGLIWGVSDYFERFNRFALSASGERVVIMQADRNNRRVFHRFRSEEQPNVPMRSPITFSILRAGTHHHFFINGHHVCTAHNQHFIYEGNQVGFYLEPRMHIRSTAIRMQALSGIQPLRIEDMLKKTVNQGLK